MTEKKSNDRTFYFRPLFLLTQNLFPASKYFERRALPNSREINVQTRHIFAWFLDAIIYEKFTSAEQDYGTDVAQNRIFKIE